MVSKLSLSIQLSVEEEGLKATEGGVLYTSNGHYGGTVILRGQCRFTQLEL
jgi:hypothetical protein